MQFNFKLGPMPERRAHSGTSSALMRRNRILERGIPALRAAVEAKLITTYRAGEIARLPRGQQMVAIEQWSARGAQKEQGQAIAACVLRKALAQGEGPIDLEAISSAIRDAVAQSV
jgi:hypothetical protein